MSPRLTHTHSPCQCEEIEMRIRNYSNTLSYEVITMTLRTSRLPRQSLTMGIPRRVCPLQAVGGRRQEAGVRVVGVGVIEPRRACIHFQKTFVFVRYSFVERVLNIYLWEIRQPVATPTKTDDMLDSGYFDSNKLGSKYMARQAGIDRPAGRHIDRRTN